MKLHPVVLSGGSGTRLWPLSRDNFPKQFLPIFGRSTLLQETLLRLDGLTDVAPALVVCNEAHRFLAVDQLRQIGKEPLDIVIEPVARNTAPALTLAALALTGRDLSAADPIMVVMPSDHLIRDVAALHAALEEGASLADAGLMVTFGIAPRTPASGFGYIKRGESLDGPTARRIEAFVEKPDQGVAAQYMDSGEWYWNSGIFMMRASVWLSELERSRPAIGKACRAAQHNGHRDGEFFRPGAPEFIECPSESIDYAVMESAVGPRKGRRRTGATGGAVVPLDAGWSDLGAWSVLWEEDDQDREGNVVQGDVYTHATERALLIAQHRLLATVGVEDVVVVETPDAVLVAGREHVQDVKKIVERLKEDGRVEHASHRKVHRPWGTYEVMDSGPGFQVKRLSINAGAAISLQKHRHRAEHWIVVEGTARVTRDGEVSTLQKNQSSYVAEGATHRLENPGDSPLQIIEVQTGDYLGEDDIVRFEDRYNRHDDG